MSAGIAGTIIAAVREASRMLARCDVRPDSATGMQTFELVGTVARNGGNTQDAAKAVRNFLFAQTGTFAGDDDGPPLEGPGA